MATSDTPFVRDDMHSDRLRTARKSARRGSILLLAAFFTIVMIAVLAFAIDLGNLVLVRTQLQVAADSAALAGAGGLVEGPDQARANAEQYGANHLAGGHPLKIVPGEDVELGRWDVVTRTFVPVSGDMEDKANAILFTSRLTAGRGNAPPSFFGRLFGFGGTDMTAQAIATYQPRDIMLVLDYSGSMNDDSELKSINTIGQANIEANLLAIYNELGSPVFGNMQWNPVYLSSDNNSAVLSTLGLDAIPYPYPSGSWSDCVNYVRTSGNVNRAGYRKRYGYLTLVNYWLERRPMHSQTPDLWMTSEQPLKAVKDSVTVLLAAIAKAGANDRVGLSAYTYSDGTARLESGLTTDLPQVETLSRERRAGHYDRYTNISAGMRKARIELENNARKGAFKLMLLLTDGKANRPYGTTAAKRFVLDEANKAAGVGIPVLTVSLGAGADTALMQQVADVTGGAHFNIPGGQSVKQYEEQLKALFRKIAADRALTLVQ